MNRLTTRHQGVAVIRDKSKLKEAMEKLARYEELEDEGTILDVLDEFKHYICDMVCGNLDDVPAKDVNKICSECKVDAYCEDIRKRYVALDNFAWEQISAIAVKNHGDWVNEPETASSCSAWQCSNCKQSFGLPWINEFKYCPNCGARMGKVLG